MQWRRETQMYRFLSCSPEEKAAEYTKLNVGA